MTDSTLLDSSIEDRWTKDTRPQDADGWLARAGEVADILAADAVERDAANATPSAERRSSMRRAPRSAPCSTTPGRT